MPRRTRASRVVDPTSEPLPFGDRDATLSTIKGGYAAVVDATENPAWLLTGTDISQDDFAAIAAKLHLIDE